ncbi:MAG: SulP family inorganic anion transporter [Anaerolineaceae bacterium]|nr:MAG: SulP family inorganic anion transporter [Anaerolineaceae bacterium]
MTVTTLTKQKSKRTLRSFFPILSWLPKYKTSWLSPDTIAALTVWALLVPEAMAYAGIAGMPPEYGLYAAPLALLGYAIFGTSKHLNVGPSSTVAALSFSTIAGLGVASGSEEWIALTAALAILTGVFLVIGGLLRLGVLADFLSRPVLDGFIVGVAITIVVGQLDKLLGYEVESELEFIPDILLILSELGMTHWPTLLVGLVSLALLFLIEKYLPRVPAAITVLVLAIVVSALLDFESLGIHIVGEIPAGLPDFGLPGITLDQLASLIPGALAVVLVAYSESIAAARSYAAKFNYKVDADQEFIGLGAANMGSGISGAFVVDGSLSKTAASVEAGAKTQMVSIIAAIAVLITAVALTPLFRTLPEATLGAIVIHAVWHLINFRKIRKYRSITSLDFWTALVAMLGVLAVGILEGLLIAVFLGLLGLLYASKSRTSAVLAKVPGQEIYRSLENNPEGETYPGLLITRFEGSLFFANAPDMADEIRYGVEVTEPSPRVVLVDFESITEVDATALITLSELNEEMERAGTDLRLARVRAHVLDLMRTTELDEEIGPVYIYDSVHAGVDAFLAEPQDEEQEQVK